LIIQIRVVIDVPKEAEAKYQEVIEDTIDFIVKQFPEYKTVSAMQSPVIVTIDQFDKLEKK
jgi:hypothetical protein